ncbi:CcmD family protein [Desulfuribacillus stibiiarsenatis]|nr:CcmD family protein [Desulfuribacillus stibiiarsenatis]
MGLNYLFAAYFIIWTMIFFYTLSLGRRQSQLAKELDVISEQLQSLESKK